MDNLTGLLFSLICFDQVRQDIFGKVREQKHLEPAVDHCQMPVDSLECIQYGFSSIISVSSSREFLTPIFFGPPNMVLAYRCSGLFSKATRLLFFCIGKGGGGLRMEDAG
jgi:hypothetical protein